MTADKAKSEEKKQRDLIRAFDREIMSYQSYGLPESFKTGFWGFMASFFMIVPCQVLWEENELRTVLILALVWCVSAPATYISGYQYIKEQGKTVPYYKKIKYLPIDIKQVRLVRAGYLLQFLKKTGIVSILLQCLSTLLICHTLSVWNLLYVAVFGVGVPFLICLAGIWVDG